MISKRYEFLSDIPSAAIRIKPPNINVNEHNQAVHIFAAEEFIETATLHPFL